MSTTQELAKKLKRDNWIVIGLNILGAVAILYLLSIVEAASPFILVAIAMPILIISTFSINLSSISKRQKIMVWPYYVAMGGYALNIISSINNLSSLVLAAALCYYSYTLSENAKKYNHSLETVDPVAPL